MSIVPKLNVRRLAAIDMHGAAGHALRRRVILGEFIVGAVGITLIGVWCLFGTDSLGWHVVGVVGIGVGLNYVPLAVHALTLSRPGRLDAELRGVDLAREGRYYTAVQFLIFVPLLVVVLALRQSRQTG
jgi:hypothetical protein